MNQDFEWLDIVENAVSKRWKKCFVDTGIFEIYTAATPRYVDLLQRDRYIVRRDDDMIGVIEHINMQTDADGRDMLLVAGRCAKSLFARRIINRQQIFSGTVWNRMYWMLHDHAVAPSAENRKIPNVEIKGVADEIKGPAAQTQHTGTNLLQAVTDLLASNNLGWKITQDGEKFSVQMLAGVDRTVDQTDRDAVIFSDGFDNLISSEYDRDNTEYANVAIVAGEGEGAARVWTGVDATGKASGKYAGLNRYEMYVDARDLQSKVTDSTGKETTLSAATYRAQLQARGLEKLIEKSNTESFDGEVDIGSYIYRVDYDVGDLITVRDRHGITANTRVVAVDEIEDEDGYTITPTFSNYIITSYNYEEEEEE